jgi:hypothetical protein
MLHPTIVNLLLISVSPQFLGWLILAVIRKNFESESRVDSLSECYDGKEALITPLFKKGERNVASNYRPVSLTSVVSKILIVHSSIMRHLDHQKHSDRLSTHRVQ